MTKCYHIDSIVIVIRNFKDSETKKLFDGNLSKKFPHEIRKRAQSKLRQLDSAKSLDDLKLPPSNRLHYLKDDREGQFSIAIDMKYRICFKFENENAFDVEIVDYH